ncbi:hypothetical protein MHB47_00150 [Staphylococcus sp. FSL K6-3157]|uniref:hypothetical protein n=1 Tax=Staphylococcus sp. FSL K6-3157 TaxID=2921490 RepID=UPI0030F5E687
MRSFEDIMYEVANIHNYFNKVSKIEARNASEKWELSEANSQSGMLAMFLENISENIENYSTDELSKMIYSISRAQREIFKLI